MKKILAAGAAALLVVMFLAVNQTFAEGEDVNPGQSFAGEVICLPDHYQENLDGCQLYGPAAYLSNLAKDGITYPAPPLPLIRPSTEFAKIPYKYAKLTTPSSPLYSTIGDAMAKVPMLYIAGATRYISYKDFQETDNGAFFQSNFTGGWVDGGDAARAAPPTFQGLQLRSTPRTSFGWIISPSLTRNSPGFDGKETNREMQRYEVVTVYAIKKVLNDDWVMIGLDEWVEDRVVARVTPNTTAPAGVSNGRWIEVNLEEQTLMVYDNSQMVFATMVSTGVDPFFTKPGVHRIYEKKPAETMSGDFSGDRSGYYYLEDVPWTMYFDELRALHGAYWHTLFGYGRSHGCVNLSIGDSRWLYDWAKVGDYVYVWDPTGKTPTDPKFYTKGGA